MKIALILSAIAGVALASCGSKPDPVVPPAPHVSYPSK